MFIIQAKKAGLYIPIFFYSRPKPSAGNINVYVDMLITVVSCFDGANRNIIIGIKVNVDDNSSMSLS